MRLQQQLVFPVAPQVAQRFAKCLLLAAHKHRTLQTQLSNSPFDVCFAVGGVVGFALVYGGASAVIWCGMTNSFPYLTGVVVIVASWFISPLLAGLLSYVLFFLLKFAVLRGPAAPKKAIWCLPLLLLITMFVNM